MSRNVMVERAEAASNSRLRALLDAKAACETIEFTPGPWWTNEGYSENEGGIAVIAANTDCGPLPGNPTRGMVAFATELLIDRAKICQANARLIAAAPDLYAVLEDIMSIDENGSGLPEYMEIRILAVLAQARGEKTQGSDK